MLTELPEEGDTADHHMLASAVDLVHRHIDGAPQDHHRAQLSGSCHYFEAAAASSLDEVRGLIDKYDYLRPFEQPVDAFDRKQQLIQRWIDVQIIRKKVRKDRELASLFADRAYLLPHGMRPKILQRCATSVNYNNFEQLYQDMAHYKATLSPLPLEWDTSEIDDDYWVRGPFSIFQYPDGTFEVSVENQHVAFGVQAMERYAYVVDKVPEYSPVFDLTVTCPMPPVWRGMDARFVVPFHQIATLLASVTGQPQVAEITPSQFTQTDFTFPGGKLRFDGDFDNRRGVSVSGGRGGEMYAPYFEIHLDVGNDLSNAQRISVLERLSAWFTVHAQKQVLKVPFS